MQVEADVDPLFNPGDILTTVTDVECLTPGLAIQANTTGTVLEAEVEGLVSSITLPQLVINGQTVVTTAGTVFEGGTALDIDIGAKLEAEGELDTTSGILTADSIRFRDRRVRIVAPVNVPGAGLGNSFQIMDVITVNTNSLPVDGDGLVDGSGNSGNLQVEVRGYLDASDAVIATEVRDRGQAGPLRVRLRGPVGDACNPAIADVEFDILSVIVDTDPTVAMTVFAGSGGSVLTQQGFCDLAVTGTFVQAEDGEFSSPLPVSTMPAGSGSRTSPARSFFACGGDALPADRRDQV